jgi:ABC-type oligopeptide transport system substrate-binding subunit
MNKEKNMKFSMKKVISVLAVLFVAGALLASCGGQDGNQSASFDVKAFVEGYVARLTSKQQLHCVHGHLCC